MFTYVYLSSKGKESDLITIGTPTTLTHHVSVKRNPDGSLAGQLSFLFPVINTVFILYEVLPRHGYPP